MPLNPICRDLIGTTVYVRPVYAYGWSYDPKRTGNSQADPPVPFRLQLNEWIDENGQMVGGFGVVIEPHHEYDGFWVAFFVRRDDVCVDFIESFGSYNIFVAPDKPEVSVPPGFDIRHPYSSTAKGIPQAQGIGNIAQTDTVMDTVIQSRKRWAEERLRVLIAEIAELPDWCGTPPTDIHSRNALGDTPLHVAAVRGDIQVVIDLLNAGAKRNVRGEHGFTPLHEAVAHQHPEVVRLLLAHGASRTEPNDWGHTPADTARLQGDGGMLALLQ